MNKYKMDVTCCECSIRHTFSYEVEFAKEEKDYYGNGYHMSVKELSQGYTQYYDLRYDTEFDDKKPLVYITRFANDCWSGEHGSYELVGINIQEITE